MLHRHELWLLQTRRPQFCAVPAAWYYCVRRHGRLALPGLGLEPAITSGLTAITTHRHVDLGNARSDPRSFDWQQLQTRLTALGLVC